jgi:hypothetical protein
MKITFTKEKTELFIKTAVWNSLVEIFKEEKKLDISKFLISIKISKNNILIKTNKPILNSEMFLLSEKITEKIKIKLKKTDFSFDFELKFI